MTMLMILMIQMLTRMPSEKLRNYNRHPVTMGGLMPFSIQCRLSMLSGNAVRSAMAETAQPQIQVPHQAF